jgi:hypothetical protein
MTTSYPGGFDAFAAPGTNLSSTPNHDDMHIDVQDAVEAIQAELGLNPSGTFSTVAVRLAPPWITSTGVVRFGGATTNVTSSFRYRRILDTTIEWECQWILTGAPASGTLTITVPVTPDAIGVNCGIPVGQALMLDAGTGRRIGDVLQDVAAPTTFNIDINRTGYLGLVTHSSPWTWAVSDEGVATGRYRVA